MGIGEIRRARAAARNRQPSESAVRVFLSDRSGVSISRREYMQSEGACQRNFNRPTGRVLKARQEGLIEGDAEPVNPPYLARDCLSVFRKPDTKRRASSGRSKTKDAASMGLRRHRQTFFHEKEAKNHRAPVRFHIKPHAAPSFAFAGQHSCFHGVPLRYSRIPLAYSGDLPAIQWLSSPPSDSSSRSPETWNAFMNRRSR